MGKAINSFIEKQTENQSDRNVTKLTILDFNNHNGSYEKLVVKKKQQNSQVMVVVAYREVEYLRSKKVANEDGTTRWITVSSKGFETVKEVLMTRGTFDPYSIVPIYMGKVTRDLRRKEVVQE